MKLLTLLFQILSVTINVCQSENDSVSTVVFDVKEINKTDRSDFLTDSRDRNDLNFDYDDEEEVFNFKDDGAAEKQMQEALLKAMKEPGIRKQIGEVLPILRVMSSAQRLTLAALVSSQIMSQNAPNELNLSNVASMFAGKNLQSDHDRNNVTEYLLLPISMDVANMFKGLGKEVGRNLRQNFYVVQKKKKQQKEEEEIRRRQIRKPVNRSSQSVVNRRMDAPDYHAFEGKIEPLEINSKEEETINQPGTEECDYFTKSLCLEVSNYPTEAIISSLKQNAEFAKTFLIDFHTQSGEKNEQGKVERQIRGRKFERQDSNGKFENTEVENNNYMCPSAVKYARPKRARATSGHWKYIVNAADYTQTLRLEMCLKPKSSCSYVTNQLNSECGQVFNYHRLLSWDENKGLHMDVFKVPSCCTCRIQGYTDLFPPRSDITFAEKRKELLSPSAFSPIAQQHVAPSNIINNIEESKLTSQENLPSPQLKPQVFYNLNAPGFVRNPAEHLVPPGPPLPLEHEVRLNQPQESKYYNKKGPLEYNVRYSVSTESSQNPSRTTERIQVQNQAGNIINPSKTRLKTQQRPQIRRPLTNLPNTFQTNQGGFDQGSQIRYVVNSPQSRPNNEMKRIKPMEGLSFNKLTNQGSQFQNRFKSNTRQPSQYYNLEYGDSKGVPSRTSHLYTKPNKSAAKKTTTTTIRPPQKSISSDQKKVNFNYHPIIDFFKTNANRKRESSAFSAPKDVNTSQDWTPMLGRH